MVAPGLPRYPWHVGALLLNWLVMSVAVWLVAALVPGIHLRSVGAAVAVAAVYGVLNALFGWLLWVLLFPVALITLGIAVNAVLLWATDKLLDDLQIDGFVPLLIGSAGLSVSSWLIRMLLF